MGQTDMFKFVQHLIVQDDGRLPPIPDCLYAYIMAGNGVFLYAKRDELEVLIPISRATIAGLPPLEPFVKMPRVPAVLIHHILQASKENLPNEILFWFNFDYQIAKGNIQVGPQGGEGFKQIRFFPENGWTTSDVAIFIWAVVAFWPSGTRPIHTGCPSPSSTFNIPAKCAK